MVALFSPGALKEGVLLVLACAVLAVVSALVPLLFPACGLAVILMAAVTTCRHTSVYALAVLAAAAALTGFVVGILDAVMILVEPGLLGILYGLGFKNRVAPQKILAAGLVAALFLAGFDLVILFRMLGESPSELVAANLAVEGHPELVEQAVRAVSVFLPGSLVAWVIILAWAGFFVTAGILRRLSLLSGPALEFRRWHLPWPVIWLVIAGLAVTLAGDHWEFETMALIGRNVLFVAGVGFLLAGLTLAVYFYRELALSRWLAVLLVVAAVINWPVTLVLLATAGFIDSWSDCRGCYERRREQS